METSTQPKPPRPRQTGMTIRRRALVAASAAAVLFAGGCGGTDSVSAQDLNGTTWVTTTVTRAGTESPAANGSTITVTFENGRISVNAGCNTMSAGVTVEDDVLVLDGAMASTQMACDTELMNQDAWLSQFLSSKPEVTVDGSTMTLTSGESELTLTDRKVAQPDLPLEGTAWSLESMGSGTGANGSVSSVPAGVTSTLTVEGSKLLLKAGCNSGSGSVEVTDTTMKIGPIATTKMMCPPDAMSVETAVLAVLTGTVKYSIDSSQLTITGATGSLTYTGASGASATQSPTASATESGTASPTASPSPAGSTTP